ncbi:MAG: hypothetical protein EOO88_27335 [Pedobacter sp.]|nr:MAG: hypothetical protein EOO88_27335 [Pedobacter sp.]
MDSDDFSEKWLGDAAAYRALGSLGIAQLSVLLHSLEFGLGLQECVYQNEWEEAKSDRDRWQARVRLGALRLELQRLRRWKRDSGWCQVAPH